MLTAALRTAISKVAGHAQGVFVMVNWEWLVLGAKLKREKKYD